MAAALLVSCKDKNNDDNGAKAREQARLDSLNANKKVDNFLYDIMGDYYLWNSNMPRMQKDESRFPGDFFESLLFRFVFVLLAGKRHRKARNTWCI